MRISDWSSDVCSSDLDERLSRLAEGESGRHGVTARLSRSRRARALRPPEASIRRRSTEPCRTALSSCDARRTTPPQRRPGWQARSAVPDFPKAANRRRKRQTGREASREEECQYGKIYGG